MVKGYTKIVVTRHRALFEYLVKHGYVSHDTPCLSYADVHDVVHRHVYGVLPYRLASKAGLYTEVQMRVPIAMKGKELTLDDVEFLASKPKTYKVIEVPNA